MQLENFINLLSDRRGLSEGQVLNIEKVKGLAKGFHRDAGTLEHVSGLLDEEVDGDTVVLESGHQPNFLPHSGTWKKIFLLDLIAGKLREQGNSVVALFGLADLNISSPALLYKNKVPAVTKDGCMKVGFRIKDEDKYKSFCLVDKPSRDVWVRELENIRVFYLEQARLAKVRGVEGNLEEIIDVLQECYDLAGNFADLNSFIYSRICNKVWGLKVLFFRYSDVQRGGVFVDEAFRVFDSVDDYNRLFNEAVDSLGVGVSGVDSSSYPFWFHCDCGVKMPLSAGGMRCSACGKEYSPGLDESAIKKNFYRMDLSAVSRNLVFAEGLGTALFLSGSGGSLRYGLISRYVAEKMKMNLPVTLGVGGRDYYLGVVHQLALKNLIKVFDLSIKDLSDRDCVESKIREKLFEAEEGLRQANSREGMQRYRGRIVSYKTQLNSVQKLFSLSSSALDFFVSFGLGNVKGLWSDLRQSSVEECDPFFKVNCDLSYSSNLVDKDSVPKIYGGLFSLEVK